MPLWLCVLLIQSATGGATSLKSTQAPHLESELQAAGLADKAGDYATAAKRYQDFLDKVDAAQVKPQAMVEIRTRLATLYFLLHQYRDSLSAVAPLTKNVTSSALVPQQAWLVQGLDDLEINQLSEAIQSLQQALKLNPASGTGRLALGDGLARSGDLPGAIDQFKEQLHRTPEEAEAWYKLGLAYGFLSKQTSEEFWQRYPKDALGQQLKAEGAISRGSYAEALRILFGLLERNTTQAGLFADLGTALLNLGFPQTAELQFQKELERNPHSPDALFGLSVAMSLRGDWDGAAQKLSALAASNPRELTRLFEASPPIVLREALEQKQTMLPAHFAQTPLGRAWSNWLKESEADLPASETNPEKTCSEGLSLPQSGPGTWLSEACYRQVADQLRKQEGASQAERDKLAEAELRGGAPEDSETAARRTLGSAPSDAWAMYWLVRSYEALGYEAFRKVSQLRPNSTRVHQMMAKYYADKHETPRAVAEYEAALKLSPDLPDLHLGLGTAYWEAGDWDRAEPPLRKALELAPSMLAASYELGDIYVQKRQWEQAIRRLRPTLEEESLRYRACLDLSKAEAAMGHTREAVDYLLRVAKQDEDGELHYRLALLYRKIGDSAKAEAALAASNQLRQASTQYGQEVLQTMEKERQALDQPER
ncbi:MAG TPA: tetratricopeptide repeat protein [Terriglobia bacterium]|nr:tetratricopeptide repeat protein [Terriglobia bacterium]